jgi:hypothetical protein
MLNGQNESKSAMIPETIRCAKCHHANPATVQFCGACEASLYIACRACDRMNPLSRSRCLACGHRLHRRFWRIRFLLKRVRWLRWILTIKPLYILFLAAVLLFVYILITWVGSF